MIRQREPIPAQTDSRPDLYLAGMRCTQVRPPTPEEERLLGIIGYGGGMLGTLGRLFLIEVVRQSNFLRALGSGALIAALTVASIVAIAFASTVAGPALRSLRRKRVVVFQGPVLRLGGFDSNQRKLFEHRPYPDEMIVMANRRTVLRSGKRLLPCLGLLRTPCLVAPDRGPDTRQLTAAEQEELRRLIRNYRRLDPAAWMPLLTVPLGGLFFWSVLANVAQAKMAAIVILTLLGVFTVRRWQSWWAFSGRLKRDLKDGVITSGNLWSGIPWLVHGEPAPWRTARPEVGVTTLDVEALQSL
jgi:hypothetical protein